MPHAYDLAILDIMMPQMNGFQLMRKTTRADDSVKICLLTALSELSDATDIEDLSFIN
jgi:DNA-binding response OmpR family regulator